MTEPLSQSRLRLISRGVRVRARFFVLIALAGLVVGRWDDLRAGWDRLVSPRTGGGSQGSVSAGTEYFCPMDPGVLSDWPGKCSVCNMSLVRRDRGEMAALPSGVMARVSLTPERIQLAGITTATTGFQPLQRDERLIGKLAPDRRVYAPIDDSTREMLKPGVMADISPLPEEGRPSISGKFLGFSDEKDAAVAIFSLEGKQTPEGWNRTVSIRLRAPIADFEPFRSLGLDRDRARAEGTRVVFVCPDHEAIPRASEGKCPIDGKPLARRVLTAFEGIVYDCPRSFLHTQAEEVSHCPSCGELGLTPRITAIPPEGQVLAIPEMAVVATGLKSYAFVESMPGVFDAVEVAVGPRCGGFYPVVRGLESGQRVVAAGAFLLDAETRLNPSLASSYFGATRAGNSPPPESSPAKILVFSGLSADDEARARSQKICPVTKKLLGSMGAPSKVETSLGAVFTCCEGCNDAVKAEPAKYLAKGKPPAAHHP